jgi:hypothetical protein
MWPQSRFRGRQRFYLQVIRSPTSSRESRVVQPKEILITSAKRLLQQNPLISRISKCDLLILIVPSPAQEALSTLGSGPHSRPVKRATRPHSHFVSNADITAVPVSFPGSCAMGSLQIEKSLHRLYCPRRIFLLRRMTEIVKDHQRAAGDVAVEAFGILWWNQAITPTPQDEGRQF